MVTNDSKLPKEDQYVIGLPYDQFLTDDLLAVTALGFLCMTCTLSEAGILLVAKRRITKAKSFGIFLNKCVCILNIMRTIGCRNLRHSRPSNVLK